MNCGQACVTTPQRTLVARRRWRRARDETGRSSQVLPPNWGAQSPRPTPPDVSRCSHVDFEMGDNIAVERASTGRKADSVTWARRISRSPGSPGPAPELRSERRAVFGRKLHGRSRATRCHAGTEDDRAQRCLYWTAPLLLNGVLVRTRPRRTEPRSRSRSERVPPTCTVRYNAMACTARGVRVVIAIRRIYSPAHRRMPVQRQELIFHKTCCGRCGCLLGRPSLPHSADHGQPLISPFEQRWAASMNMQMDV